MSFSIAGKTAIVTGAANGVGLAIARHFIEQGANVICADMDEVKLAEEFGANPDMDVLPEGDGAEPSNVRIFAGDLRKKLTIANLLSATIDAVRLPRPIRSTPTTRWSRRCWTRT
jgi:7-alpha-hydroxysteroid dehydrogenase